MGCLFGCLRYVVPPQYGCRCKSNPSDDDMMCRMQHVKGLHMCCRWMPTLRRT